jgi:2'-5' RNA ligase
LTHALHDSSGSVGRDEQQRLFCALRLPDDILDTLVAWQRRELRERTVPRENLHVTLAFLGWRSAKEVPAVADALRATALATKRPVFELDGYRETRSVGMVTLEDEGGRATALAEELFDRLEHLGVYRREQRPWLPHVTVVRFRERPRLRPALPKLPPFSPSDAAVYLSRLRPSGAQYVVLESFALGG